MLKRKSPIVLLLVMMMVVSMAVPSNAWKLNTHVYSGNLILEDLQDGYLELDGLGTYPVPADILNAVKRYPAAYRAGTLGPDIYPELATGQGNIHPLLESSNSGDFLNLMVEAYHKLPSNHPEREKIYAFILGYSTHYAGDLFGHSFINEWSEGVFPGMMEMAEDSSKIDIALRHIASEGYVDSKVPETQRTGSNISIDAPVSFIKDVLLIDAARKYEVSPYMEGIVSLRDALKEQSEKMKAYAGGDLSLKDIAKYGVNTNIAGYAERWQQDIDTGLVAWVKANQDMAKAMLDKDKGTSDTLEPISSWVTEHGLKMSGSPDALAAALGVSVDTVLQMLDLITVEEIQEKIKQMKQDAAFWAIKEATGLDVTEMMEAMKDPLMLVNSPLFKTGYDTSSYIDMQLKNFGKTNRPAEIEFDPFYNTVQMGKLILLGFDNLNVIFPNTSFSPQAMVESFNQIEATIHTGKNSSRSWKNALSTDNKFFRGTDDDVFLTVTLKDGSTYEKLMDKPGYNDFESNDTDTYTLELPRYVTYQEVKSVGVRKQKITGDNWWPDWIEVKAKNGKLIAESGKGKANTSFNKVFGDKGAWSMNVNVSDSEIGKSSFDPSIIHFIKSLDDSNQWVYASFFNTDKAVFDTIFRNYDINYEVMVDSMMESGVVSVAISTDNASDWAKPELQAAFENGIYTDRTINGFKDVITREEFCELVVTLYEKLTKTEAEAAPFGTFSDTDNVEILKAYHLGITGGTGNNKFSPELTITREDMAVMYHRLVKAVTKSAAPAGYPLMYDDDAQIADYAKEAILYCTNNQILGGTGGNHFNPKGTLTKEMAIVVSQRVYKQLSKD